MVQKYKKNTKQEYFLNIFVVFIDNKMCKIPLVGHFLT